MNETQLILQHSFELWLEFMQGIGNSRRLDRVERQANQQINRLTQLRGGKI